ncbi:MAG TPA: VWA domain-containing protein, partial [Phycisphaerae bacterium]|nr:VWA domain-containing protein [Phycisphaerae bacterium]
SDADLQNIRKAVDDLAGGDSGASVDLVVFDSTARHIRMDDGDASSVDLLSHRAENDHGSDVEEALDLAGGLIRAGRKGKVILYSDGLQTSGSAASAAWRLGCQNIDLEVVAMGPERNKEVILASAALPASAGVGETVEMTLSVLSSRATSGKISIHDMQLAKTKAVVITRPLDKGMNKIKYSLPVAAAGLQEYEVRIVECADDTITENNTLVVSIFALPPRKIIVVHGSGGLGEKEALSAMLGDAAEVKSIASAKLDDGEALDSTDLLVLADVPAEELSTAAQQNIRKAVEAGCGLLVTGGRRSFGPGGYADTELSDILPVRFPQKLERRDPSTTLVIVIDTSGSMSGARMTMAKESARLALKRLKPHDKAGIVEFYGSKRWAAPIQPASNHIDLQRALNRLTSGGGTTIMPALEEAYYALLDVQTRTKHILIATDGGVETGRFEQMMRKMTDEGIHISTILAGPKGNSPFLARLAHWGRGKFYLAQNRFKLLETIEKQPDSSLMAPIVAQPVEMKSQIPSPVLSGVNLEKAPDIEGYVEIEAHPAADVLIRTSLGHPLLVKWRVPRGRVAALATHLSGDWTAELVKWDGCSQLISNLSRSLYAPRRDQKLRILPTVRLTGIDVEISADSPLASGSFAAVTLELRNKDNKVVRRELLDPIRPD